MAALLIRTCLKRSISRNILYDTLGNDSSRKLIITRLDITCILCNSYHSTPVLLKKRKKVAEREQIHKRKELAMLNPNVKTTGTIIGVWKAMTVKELATAAGCPVANVVEVLSFIDRKNVYEYDSIFDDPAILYETVRKLGLKFKVVVNPNMKVVEEEAADVVRRPPPDPSVLVKRRPVITIMGHVDHGKTTLLDTLRNSAIVDQEFGGITQHIGAFNVTLSNGEKMTFLDTPGHAAFSAMRARGANATDIVILVVAADDGVMEQTIQSINMAKSAKVPIIVAVNKIDKPNIDIKRTHEMLAAQEIFVEEIGGNVQSVNISALKGTNINLLMEAIAAQSEIMDLKGDPTGLVEGVIIESSIDIGRGKLATALIQRGTLRKGDVIVSGLAWAKVRAMFDDAGAVVSQAGLSDAVQIIGWRELPAAGDEILEVENEKICNRVMKYRRAMQGKAKSLEQKVIADEKHKEYLVEYQKMVKKKRALGVHKLRRQGPREKEITEDNFPKVNIILKGDVVGSVEAIMDVFDSYTEEDQCRLSVVHYGIGPVTETDVELAKTFNALIYCFNTTVPRTVSKAIIKENISVHHHNVIYKLIDDLKLEINKQLPMVQEEEEIGVANVLQEFLINEKRKKVKIAGCRCVKGVLKKSEMFKVLRDNEVIYKGKALAIRHLKEEVESIKTNTECGVKLDRPDIEFKPGDTLVCFKYVEKHQETNWNPGF